MDIVEDVYEVALAMLKGVKRSGPENIMAFCPFHDNRNTPSFTMSLSKGVYLCFSCKEKGNFKKFLEEMQVPRIVQEGRYKILLEELDKTAQRRDPQQQVVVTYNEPLPDGLLGLFQWVPEELEQEGFTEEVLHHFDVGVDKTHNRITFPLRNWKGELVGISGRAREFGQFPRYKIYDNHEWESFALPKRVNLVKKELIWNYDRVFPAVHPERNARVYVVEGFKSVMWLHQNGFPRAIALLGSFLSAEQKWLLEHLGAEVVLMFDNDEAGQKGLKYSAEALSKTLKVRVAEYDSDFKQPTDLPPDLLEEVLTNPPDYVSWLIQRNS